MKTILLGIMRYTGLVVFGMLLAIFVLEVGVRFLGAKPETYLRKFSQYHPILGWEKTPYAEGDFIRGDIRIHEKMNSRGWRDKEYTYNKPDSVFRILVLGDSFTEGYDVDETNIFTEVLERQLNETRPSKKFRSFEVINAGTGGYSNDQEYLLYQTEGYKYNPDVVLMMVYPTNDVYYNNKDKYGNYFKPLFEVSSDSLRLTNSPLPKPARQEFLKKLFRDLAIYPIVSKIILSNPFLMTTLNDLGFINESTLDANTTKPIGDSNNVVIPSSFGIYYKKSDKFIEQAWRITELIFKNAHQMTEKNGSAFVLFSIPDHFQVYSESWETTKRKYKVNESLWDRELPNRKISELSRKYGFQFINFKKEIDTYGWEQEPMYNAVHWNIRGNEIVAKCLYNEFLSRKLLPQ